VISASSIRSNGKIRSFPVSRPVLEFGLGIILRGGTGVVLCRAWFGSLYCIEMSLLSWWRGELLYSDIIIMECSRESDSGKKSRFVLDLTRD